MLQLYHWEPNGACARVMIALKEKVLEFESRYVDLLAFEQHSPAFLALSGTGETPVLVRDGEAFTESSYVCEHLDEAFPDPPPHAANPVAPRIIERRIARHCFQPAVVTQPIAAQRLELIEKNSLPRRFVRAVLGLDAPEPFTAHAIARRDLHALLRSRGRFAGCGDRHAC